MTVLIDGKAFAKRLRDFISLQVADIKSSLGVVPGLATILVGEDPASEVYVRNKSKQTIETGMASFKHTLGSATSEAEVLKLIAQLNADDRVHGILVQLPLPRHINAEKVINAIEPAKDVDGFHVSNVGMLGTGQKAMLPCTPLGCIMMLRDHFGSLSGKNALVVGRSNIVGKPMAQLLLADDCTVTMAHRYTEDLEGHCRRADILVMAVGRPEMIPGDWIKPGATVIDVGINRVERDGTTKLVGDVDFKSASLVAGAITPVPGGVGPMTIACLLFNTLTAFCRAKSIPEPEEIGFSLAEGVGIIREFKQAS
ncbi:bifunctional methylenetetrahydrofolate dehydrogenase/methenyltetrahydrofolate cyclohydrolase FolD [Rhizobium metallidurans]|uniref:Bifunctional protein FolD n=1 Tax=Rhizobium metallidurans TaxID=1265931 RepID=A0A7W6GCI6_9HYPH|nr:bifunctional methylenetetrahydrofolate dehydrogenase/methenyltetrahydrofolate cyclohydrolase FolD [Rhizobium metallidurans]MBB3966100.1 methylenetetrahydrofolate dehydrogenase (NADP+)/methenyltetrahydrofolate cyclohydrolase [Rhizobium metallidurans]